MKDIWPTRAEIERGHGVTVEPLFVKSHSSVYYHVAKGLTAAGGGIEVVAAAGLPAIRAKSVAATESCCQAAQEVPADSASTHAPTTPPDL